MIILIHLFFAILLFIFQNKLGAKAYSIGYVKFSLLDEKDEALSINFVLKVFGPIVFLILLSAILQYLNLIEYKVNIINVIYYYIAIRIMIIFLYERVKIVNWGRIIFYYITIIILARVFYTEFIDKAFDLLPDLDNIKNEIWLLIILFLYELGNGFQEKIPNNQYQETNLTYLPDLRPRKKRYILSKYNIFKQTYESILPSFQQMDANFIDPNFRVTIISILIFENFNRPRIIRFLERIWVRISKQTVTQGVMQVSSSQVLSDVNSLKKGMSNLSLEYSRLKAEDNRRPFSNLIKKHCPDRKYVRQVLFIAKCIIDNSEDNSNYQGVMDEITVEFDLFDRHMFY